MQFYQLILSVDTAVDAADTGEERTQEVKQRLGERIIYTPLPVQTCAYVCVRTKKKKKIQAPPSLSWVVMTGKAASLRCFTVRL